MTTVPEAIPACSKKRLAFRLAALSLVSFFGLYVGTHLSGTYYSVSVITLGFLIPLALLMTVLDLKRSLPLQNIIVIVALIILAASLLEIVILRSAFPFGENDFYTFLGTPLFNIIRWRVPLLWAVNLLNSRSVARLVLASWRNSRNYGFLSLGVTALLTALSNLSIEYFGGMEPQAAFFIYAIAATIILTAATPWLIIKKPGPVHAPAFAPLLLWAMLLGFLFGLGNMIS